jgi:hypothetical protein
MSEGLQEEIFKIKRGVNLFEKNRELEQTSFTEAGISVNLGHPQGFALKSTLNFLGRIPCLSLIGIHLQKKVRT